MTSVQLLPPPHADVDRTSRLKKVLALTVVGWCATIAFFGYSYRLTSTSTGPHGMTIGAWATDDRPLTIRVTGVPSDASEQDVAYAVLERIRQAEARWRFAYARPPVRVRMQSNENSAFACMWQSTWTRGGAAWDIVTYSLYPGMVDATADAVGGEREGLRYFELSRQSLEETIQRVSHRDPTLMPTIAYSELTR